MENFDRQKSIMVSKDLKQERGDSGVERYIMLGFLLQRFLARDGIEKTLCQIGLIEGRH